MSLAGQLTWSTHQDVPFALIAVSHIVVSTLFIYS